MTTPMANCCLRAIGALAITAASSGCADSGDQAFFVINNSAPAGECTFTGERDQAFLSNGHILTISPAGYQLFPLLESKITALEGQEQQRTISLQGARIDLSVEAVTLTNSTGNTTDITAQQAAKVGANLTRFKQLRSGSLSPGGTANIGLEVVPWGVIPQISEGITLAAGDRFHAVIAATVVVYGEMGGSEVESDPFTYPVEVCNDCIANVVGACPATPNVAGHPCNPYQDGTIDCCMDTANRLVCPASP